MRAIQDNPWRGTGILADAPEPRTDAGPVQRLLASCPAHHATPLCEAPALARASGVGAVWIKDERQRMGLGSFKALGAAFVIARDADQTGAVGLGRALSGRTYVTASAGNHGLSVAAGARLFGARAVIFIAETVPQAFADRLASFGAEVRRAGAHYEASTAAAAEAAETHGWDLLSDSSWPGYTEPALGVMQGYLQMASEIVAQVPEPPTHVLLQAGVGGMAAAVAAYLRDAWGDGPVVLVIEPTAAPALAESIAAGRLLDTDGPVSSMGRLDCKTPSLVALRGLSRDADGFVLLGEADAAAGTAWLAAHGFETTPSGGAGLAALHAGLGLPPDARVLAVLSEGPERG